MTLEESTTRIEGLSLDDLDAMSHVVTGRARAVVEFAALADIQALEDAKAAGQALILQLLNERARLMTELRNSRIIHDSLACNLPPNEYRSLLIG